MGAFRSGSVGALPRGFRVQHGFGNLRELGVRCFLFLQRLFEQASNSPRTPIRTDETFASGSYLQDLLTILTDAISISPCSSLFFFIPAEAAASLASSFALCIVTLETIPLAVTVWPT